MYGREGRKKKMIEGEVGRKEGEVVRKGGE